MFLDVSDLLRTFGSSEELDICWRMDLHVWLSAPLLDKKSSSTRFYLDP